MKHLKGNPETLDSINLHLENIIEIMEENDLYYDWTTIYDIMCHGAFGLVFQLEMDYDELPEGLECECDDLSDELHDLFEGDLDLMEQFVEEFLNEYGI